MRHIPGCYFLFLFIFAAGLTPFCLGDQCSIALAELSHLRPVSLYDKTTVAEYFVNHPDVISYGSELTTPNDATTVTMVSQGQISLIHVDGNRVSSRQIWSMVNSLRSSPALLLGYFDSPQDPYLKQKMDAGLQGAVLRNPSSADEVESFLRNRIYFTPLGERPVGPAGSSGFLSEFGDMISRGNNIFIGGTSIGTKEGVEAIESIVDLKNRGLRLILVDQAGIARSMGVEIGSVPHREALRRIEKAASQAGIVLGTRVKSRNEALELAKKGYRHFTIGSDLDGIDAYMKKFDDIPRDPTLEPPKLSESPIGLQGANPVKRWMNEGKVVPVGFLMTPDIEYAKILAQHTSALWIDGEHGAFSPEDVVAIIKALPQNANAIVRVTQFDNPDIETFVRAGAKGIVAPSINNAKEAETFVTQVKRVNPHALAIVMIETKAGVDAIDQIVEVAGVDVIHLGPFDLETSLRAHYGDIPEVSRKWVEGTNQGKYHKEHTQRIEAAARRKGIPLGGDSKFRKQTYQLLSQGYGFITRGSDQEGILDSIKDFFVNVPKPYDVVKVYKKNQQPQEGRFVQAAILASEGQIWQQRGDGTQVQLVHFGDGLSIQLVKKTRAEIGKTYSHSHPEGQVTIIMKGKCTARIGSDKEHLREIDLVELSAGDMAFIPAGVYHEFVDKSEEIEVIDLFVTRRKQTPEDLK